MQQAVIPRLENTLWVIILAFCNFTHFSLQARWCTPTSLWTWLGKTWQIPVCLKSTCAICCVTWLVWPRANTTRWADGHRDVPLLLLDFFFFFSVFFFFLSWRKLQFHCWICSLGYLVFSCSCRWQIFPPSIRNASESELVITMLIIFLPTCSFTKLITVFIQSVIHLLVLICFCGMEKQL